MSPRSVRDDSTARTNQTRRRFLLGAGALTAALAGCTGDDDDSNDDPTDDTTDTPDDDSPDDGSDGDDPADAFDPASELAYGEWLTAEEDSLLFAYANVEALPEDAIGGGSSEPSIDDPLVLYPLVVGGVVVGLGQLSLPYAGLSRAINPEASADSTVRELTVINRTVVAEGTFATGQLEERLTEPADETFGVAHERTGTIGPYDRYEPVEVPESVESAPAVAVTEETVIVSRDLDRLERTIAAGDGDRSRVFETDETVAELLEVAGTGDLVIGQLGVPYEQVAGENLIQPDPEFKPRSDEDLIASVAFDAGGERLDSEFALAAADLGEDRQETIEASFGTAALTDSESVTVSSDRVTASGAYEADQLTGGTTEQELSPAAAAELVSPDALTLQYEPPRGQSGAGELWVTVTEDTDAAAIRVETDSGNANEIEPQDGPVTAGTSVAAPVDPDGDAVTVLAVDDEGAAGELLSQSVPTAELSETAAAEAVPEEALSFGYESPETGDLGRLTVEVVAETDADTLIAQPQEAPSLFTDRVGSLTADEPIGTSTTLETSVEPDGDEVVVYATVDDATGEVARWSGPE